MPVDHIERKRSSGQVRRVRILGACLVAAFALSAVAAGSASAALKVKKGVKEYSNCPTEGESHGIKTTFCVWASTEGGETGGYFTVGHITVPLLKPVVLQYGLAENEETEEEFYVPPLHGVEAITPTPEKVPGEPIADITAEEQNELGWPEGLKARYAEGQKKHTVKTVYETIELAGIPATSRGNILRREGTGVEAPVKIKGENKWLAELGDVCYIGSEENPIVQHLTSGASTSPSTGETIEGAVYGGAVTGEENGELEALEIESLLVDNTFAVPTANCTGPYSSYVAATIDKEFDLPQEAGNSVTELSGQLYNARASYVQRKLH